MAIVWNEMFPTKLTVFIFLGYMSLFIGQGIFVTASQDSNNSYEYNTVIAVLFTEILKLIVSTCLYCRERTLECLVRDVRKDFNVMVLYFVPALLYCLYNNLAFVNLAIFDPTTYYLLLQFRVVITGVLFQIIFKKFLSRRQWFSLMLLTFGCMLKQVNFDDVNTNSEIDVSKTPSNSDKVAHKNTTGFDLSISAVFMLAQTFASCLAGVYNEYLLKDKGCDVNIFVQNVFMYLDSIVCNVALLLVRGDLLDVFTCNNIKEIFKFNVIIIMINNAAVGIVTSFFLKYMNSILKTFASALELVFTAVLSYFLFGIPIYINTAFAIGVVSLAIYLYSQTPVVNKGKISSTRRLSSPSMKRKLLDSEHETDLEMETV